MNTVAQIELSWHLWQERIHPDNIASRTGKNRATVYRWIKRFKTIGLKRTLKWYKTSKKGKRRKRIPVETKLKILNIRNTRHQCCAVKIQYFLETKHKIRTSVSTINRVLRNNQVLTKRYRARKYGEAPKGQYARDVIQADTVDFGEVLAFTYIDTFTREAHVDLELGLEAEDGLASLTSAQKCFTKTRLLQTDGGPEFKGVFARSTNIFSQEHRVSRPFKKNEQSFIESFNRTLRKECLGWRKYTIKELPKMLKMVKDFLIYYNTERPHLGLGMRTPSDVASLSHIS